VTPGPTGRVQCGTGRQLVQDPPHHRLFGVDQIVGLVVAPGPCRNASGC
jgi:hypothetical protein